MFFFFEDEYINTHGNTVPSVIDDQNVTEETKNNYTESLFDSIKHINEYGEEFWYARELAKVLEYKDFRNFELTIFKAMEACSNSGFEITDHFGEATEMVAIGSGAQRGFNSYILDRYACYLIVMNGDPKKEIIALGQTYFAVKTDSRNSLIIMISLLKTKSAWRFAMKWWNITNY